MLKNHLFLKLFLEGQEGHEAPSQNNGWVSRGSFWSKTVQKRSKKRTNEPLCMRWQVWCMYGRAWWAKKWKCWKTISFYMFFWGGQRGKNIPRVEKGDGEDRFLLKKRSKKKQKESKWASRHEVASMMRICSGLVGPKSGNVEKPLVFKAFFEGSSGPRGPQPK